MPEANDENEEDGRPPKRPRLTLYDAVAGRASYEGFLSIPKPSKHRDWTSTTLTSVPPEEVLFRFEGAPVRYEENDIYFADRHLDPTNELQRLPDSDLLKILHAYTSDFYAATSRVRGDETFESLDETALLALGILVEEAAKGIWEGGGREEEDESTESESDIKSETTDSSMKSESKAKVSGVHQTIPSFTEGHHAHPKVEPGTSQSTLDGDVDMKPSLSAKRSMMILSGHASGEQAMPSGFRVKKETLHFNPQSGRQL